MEINEIPGKLHVAWNEEAKAIIDTWTSYSITLEDFREAVLVKGLNHAKANGGVAWIVDSTKAEGVFSKEIQDFIGTDIFPAFSQNGIKYFLTITSQVDALSRMTVKKYSAKTGPNNLQLGEFNSVDDAIMWLKEQ